MKDKKKPFILTICLTLCMCAIVILIVLINNLHLDSRGLEYKINADNTTCTITGLGTYSSKDLVIPDTIDSYKVTAIADYAFKGTDIETFSGGENITKIGVGAFQDCQQLKTAIVSAGVIKIEEECFRDCSELRRLTLPPNLIEIGTGAFGNCHVLQNIDMPNTTKIIGNSAFYGCFSLKSITIPNGVVRLDGGAFFGCVSLKSITIPNSVLRIDGGAFAYCVSLTNINFPASVRGVGEGLVSYNNLTTINVDTNSPVLSSIDGNLYADDSSVFINYACAKPESTFDIPEGVVRIGTWSFAGCYNLESISIPKSVIYIGFEIFYKSPNIETIYYDGTVEDWKRIDKEADWNANTESIFTIICTDGTIAMDGKITYN